ncbi:MAG TPA: hypothetical protein PKO06_07795 [Candidatus Ozemobacteraceae bacterium]|nr:hypothetical protein [Candidatus Ozemobacteraceae bacterium]
MATRMTNPLRATGSRQIVQRLPWALTLVWLFAVLFVFGCGGGGGSGGGRQILPGENPVGPTTPTTPTTPATSTPIIPTPTPVATPGAYIINGWIDMGYGNYSSAQQKFQTVLGLASSTSAEKADALNGIGWAKGKNYGIAAGANDFIQAGAVEEAIVGLAAAYVQSADPAKIVQAVSLLESIGMGDPLKPFVPVHPSIGVTNAEVHAMLAYAYYWSGNEAGARAQINAARASVDPNAASSVNQIYQSLKQLGLTGI